MNVELLSLKRKTVSQLLIQADPTKPFSPQPPHVEFIRNLARRYTMNHRFTTSSTTIKQKIR